MKYKSDVPKKEQIRRNEFPLLPGDDIILYDRAHHPCQAHVLEIISVNPEYVLGGPNAKNAACMTWNEIQRGACHRFLHKDHRSVHLRLQKNMWAVLGLAAAVVLTTKNTAITTGILKGQITLYTYQIVNLMKCGNLQIVVDIHSIGRTKSRHLKKQSC